MTQFLDDPTQLDGQILSLALEIHTVDAPDAQTLDHVYCNVMFEDGTLLFTPKNHRLSPPVDLSRFPPQVGFVRGSTHTFALPIPQGLERKVSDIAEFYLRKDGKDGWLLGSALLFANGIQLPVLGNSQINQFLDNDETTLFIRDWSTRSLCGSSSIPAKYPLLCPEYRIAGPVLGQLSDNSANILYRVDREGDYSLRVSEVGSGQVVFHKTQTLSPTATFQAGSLAPNTHYRFSLSRVSNGREIPEPDGDGEFRTFPVVGTGVRLSFAFGSCSRNRYDVAQQAWTGIKLLAADPSVDSSEAVRFFLQLGDTFYFYDDVIGKEPAHLATVLAANLSQRRHPRFLEMARVVPCCALWDDHDFRRNDVDSVGFAAKAESLEGFLRYWGNNPLAPQLDLPLGLTTLLSYGNVDVYLLDGRFQRDRKAGVCFGKAQLQAIIELIDARASSTNTGRLVILASGTTWNHTMEDGEPYGGDSSYDDERESFYSDLNQRIGSSILGLVFLSGDIHIHEVYDIELASQSGGPVKLAPEFVSSPMGHNSSLKEAYDLVGERKVSFPSKGDDGRKGFAVLEIDSTHSRPDGNWKLRAKYYDANAAVTTPYHTRDYVLREGQFVFIE